MTERVTSNDLLSAYIDLEAMKEMAESEEECQEYDAQQAELRKRLQTKADHIDAYILELHRRKARLQAERDVHKQEIERLKTRERVLQRTEDYLNDELLPYIIRTLGTDDTFETEIAKYTLYTRPGKVIVDDEAQIPEGFIREQITRRPDKRALRETLMNGTESIPGVRLETVQAVRRS